VRDRGRDLGEGAVGLVVDARVGADDEVGSNAAMRSYWNPSVGVIFLIPGRNETLRVDGEGWSTTDPVVLQQCQREERRTPKTAIGVRVRSVFFHCPSSFQRAGLWDQAGWRPDVAQPFDDFIRAALPREKWPEWA
jgi:predicted pyridoxine 5'-phosphate oxidase superfamily flavin-nucleotide-binding protein